MTEDLIYVTGLEIRAYDQRDYPAKHGQEWSKQDDGALMHLFFAGDSVFKLAEQFERTSYAIICKLENAGFLKYRQHANDWKIAPLIEATYLNHANQKEPAMALTYNTGCDANVTSPCPTSAKLVEEVHTTLIDGRNGAAMSDEQLYHLIRDKEFVISSYEQIQNKPKKLQALISKLRDDIADLVMYVDNRS